MIPSDRTDTELSRLGVRMSSVFGIRNDAYVPNGFPWTCTLSYKRRRITISYYTHPRLEEAPTAVEVLVSLFKDAHDFERAGDFLDFCHASNYERDRRRSEWVYTACGHAAARLRHLFGDDYAEMAVVIADLRSVTVETPEP